MKRHTEAHGLARRVGERISGRTAPASCMTLSPRNAALSDGPSTSPPRAYKASPAESPPPKKHPGIRAGSGRRWPRSHEAAKNAGGGAPRAAYDYAWLPHTREMPRTAPPPPPPDSRTRCRDRNAVAAVQRSGRQQKKAGARGAVATHLQRRYIPTPRYHARLATTLKEDATECPPETPKRNAGTGRRWPRTEGRDRKKRGRRAPWKHVCIQRGHRRK